MQALALAAKLILSAVLPAHAQQNYPNRTVTIVNPTQAGATTDVLARALVVGLSSRLGQQFVVVNRTGASGAIGQGNRVNKSCCDKACEEVVVPSGDFSFEAQAVLSGGPSDQVVGHVFYGGEVGGSVIGADAAFVVAEDHVHDPV